MEARASNMFSSASFAALNLLWTTEAFLKLNLSASRHDEPHHRFLVRELFLLFGEPFEMLVEILHQVCCADRLPDRLGIVIECQEAQVVFKDPFDLPEQPPHVPCLSQ
jgi:hypothetical protein